MTPEQIAAAKLQAIINNKELLKEFLPPTKPAGYSKRSNCPYYKQKFALEYRDALEYVLANGKKATFFYKDFNLSKTSLYLRVTQGRQFLLDHLDPDKKYFFLDSNISIARERGIGVEILVHSDLKESKPFLPTIDGEESNAWRHKMEDWIEHGEDGSEYVVENLTLGEEEIEKLKYELAPFDSVIGFSITQTKIKLRKIPQYDNGETPRLAS